MQRSSGSFLAVNQRIAWSDDSGGRVRTDRSEDGYGTEREKRSVQYGEVWLQLLLIHYADVTNRRL